jgi:RNA polymerase sigma factor (sigma-70 family)
VQDAEIARDLAQEALLQAYLSLARLREDERFESWLCGIVRNVCHSYLRSRTSGWLSLEALTGGVPLGAAVTENPQQVAEARERSLSARAAIDALAPQDREVARLFYEDQLSVQEIAVATGLTVPGVKNRLYRARKQLRERLLADYPELCRRDGKGNRPMTRVTVSGVFEDERPEGRLSTVVLTDEAGKRALHIGMSPADAAALAAGLRPLSTPLPMTAGFVAGILEVTGGKLEEVRIEALKQGVFVAVAKLRRGKTVREIEARPSDALALAVQTGSPIYVADTVMGQAGLDVSEAPTVRGSAAEAPIPERLPVTPLRDDVYFPRSIAPLFVGREKSLRALAEAEAAGRYLLLLTQKESTLDDPQPEQIYSVGIVVQLLNVLRLPDNTVRVLVEGKTRARVRQYLQTEPFHQADVELLPEVEAEASGSEALIERLLTRYQELAQQGKLGAFAPGADWSKHQGPGQVADALTSYLPLPVETKQAILETTDPRQRLEKLSAALA